VFCDLRYHFLPSYDIGFGVNNSEAVRHAVVTDSRCGPGAFTVGVNVSAHAALEVVGRDSEYQDTCDYFIIFKMK